jgi:hypothetical protein
MSIQVKQYRQIAIPKMRLASHHSLEGWVNNRKWDMTQVCYWRPTSELYFQRKLNRAWSANLVERIETAIRAS